MKFQNNFETIVNQIRREGRYREFRDIERLRAALPQAIYRRSAEAEEKRVTVWCSNDYLGMSQHPKVIEAASRAIERSGAGAGGTRNISGNSHDHILLERQLAQLHGKDRALVFTSGYVANDASLTALAKILPDCVFLSDSKNHASMIAGIRNSGAEYQIFRHNDIEHLRELLNRLDPARPKVIACESLYSMDGDIAPLSEIIGLAKRFGALTYVDEVHAVGLYGPRGGGLSEMLGLSEDVDFVVGTLGKAFGAAGGYIAGGDVAIDALRSIAPGFIFTTSLPPAVVAAALASVTHLMVSNTERSMHQTRARKLKRLLESKGLPILRGDSHIVPLMVWDSIQCKHLSDILLEEYDIYVQPINYPTVERGQERLRLTPSPLHDDEMMDTLVSALDEIWTKLALNRTAA